MFNWRDIVEESKELQKIYLKNIYNGFALDKHFLKQDRVKWSADLRKAFEKVKNENTDVQA